MIKNKEEIKKKIKEYISTREFKGKEEMFATIFRYLSNGNKLEHVKIRYFYYEEELKELGIEIEDALSFSDEFKFINSLKITKIFLDGLGGE